MSRLCFIFVLFYITNYILSSILPMTEATRRIQPQRHHRVKTDFNSQIKVKTFGQCLPRDFDEHQMKNGYLSFPSLQTKTRNTKMTDTVLSPRNLNKLEGKKQNIKMLACPKVEKIKFITGSRKVHFEFQQQNNDDNQRTENVRSSLAQKLTSRFDQDSETREVKYLKGKLIQKQINWLLNQFSQEECQQFHQDLEFIDKIFKSYLKEKMAYICLGSEAQMQTCLGKLIFFIGLQLERTLKKDDLRVDWLESVTRCIHYQIYYSILLKIYPLALESIIECARIYSNEGQFDKSEYFCELALKMAITEEKQYYEESALEQIGLCQYRRGNIDEARLIHQNISNVSPWSKKHLLKFYDQQKYMLMLRGYLFEGADLITSRNLDLIETIVFQKTGRSQQRPSRFMGQRSSSRLAISSTNKTINEFRITQEKANDLRKKSNQEAIKSIRFKHLYQIQEESIKENLESKKIMRPSRSLAVEIHNNVMKTHQSWNRNQDKNSESSSPHIQKNIRLFFKFLQSIKQTLLTHEGITSRRGAAD